MHRNNETTTVLEDLDNTIFNHHTAQLASDDLDAMFLHCIGDENFDDHRIRQSITQSFISLKRVTQCVRDKKHPNDVLVLEIRIDV